MKFRKGLISAAAAAAVLASGVSVANAEEPAPKVPAEAKTADLENGSSIKDLSPREVQDWIAVATAVIGLLSTIFAFADKYLKP